jgi:hypothetical protein
MTRPCRHHRQEIVLLRDFKREQRCLDCGAVVFRLPPANPTHAELRAEAERRHALLAQGWPLTPNGPTP